MADKVKVTLVKSPIGAVPKTRRIVESLGLHKVGQSNELPDTDATKGAVRKVAHLVKVEEI